MKTWTFWKGAQMVGVVTLDADAVTSEAPVVENRIMLDRGAYLPVPQRIRIVPEGEWDDVSVYLTQGAPGEFDPANDPLIYGHEGGLGLVYTCLVLDLAPYRGGVLPEGADYRQVPPRLAACRGILVVSDFKDRELRGAIFIDA